MEYKVIGHDALSGEEIMDYEDYSVDTMKSGKKIYILIGNLDEYVAEVFQQEMEEYKEGMEHIKGEF